MKKIFVAASALFAMLATSTSALAEAPKGEETVKAKTCPVLKVAVDVGHSPKRYGATSALRNKEFVFNKQVVTKLLDLIKAEAPRITPTLINPEFKEIRLKERTDQALKAGAKLFISVHHDAAQLKYFKPIEVDGRKLKHTPTIKGFSSFIRPGAKNTPNYRLAIEIMEKFLELGRKPTLHHAEPIKGENRKILSEKHGVYEAPFAVVKNKKLISVLVEVGVITNLDEERKLSRSDHQQQTAKALLDALKSFWQKHKKCKFASAPKQ